MSHKLNSAIAAIGIDIGKNSFHVVGHERGAITLRQKWSRGQVEAGRPMTLAHSLHSTVEGAHRAGSFEAGRFLNQHCASALDFESMFRAETLKILLQQYLPIAT
jgi:hypothetical protein